MAPQTALPTCSTSSESWGLQTGWGITGIPAMHNPYGGACPPAALWSGRSHSLPHSPAGSFWGAAGLFAEGPPGAGMTRTVHPPHLASNPCEWLAGWAHHDDVRMKSGQLFQGKSQDVMWLATAREVLAIHIHGGGIDLIGRHYLEGQPTLLGCCLHASYPTVQFQDFQHLLKIT